MPPTLRERLTELPFDTFSRSERDRLAVALAIALDASHKTSQDVEIRTDDTLTLGTRVHRVEITVRLSKPL